MTAGDQRDAGHAGPAQPAPRPGPQERLAALEDAIEHQLYASPAVVAQAAEYVRKARTALAAEPPNVSDAEHYLLLGGALRSRARDSDAGETPAPREAGRMGARPFGAPHSAPPGPSPHAAHRPRPTGRRFHGSAERAG